MKLRHAGAAMLLVLCTGCVSMGTNYDPAAVSRLQPGQSQEAVVQMLGKPTTMIRLADGSRHIIWNYSKGSMFGANARQVTLLFSPDGKFVHVVSEVQTNLR